MPGLCLAINGASKQQLQHTDIYLFQHTHDLQRCSWVFNWFAGRENISTHFSFEERNNNNNRAANRHGLYIVKCKLEDLPGTFYLSE